MKMEREQFKGYATYVAIVAKEVAVSTTMSGIALFGSTMTLIAMGFGKKHPVISGICAGALAAITVSTVMDSDKLHDAIIDSADQCADRVTTIFYGP